MNLGEDEGFEANWNWLSYGAGNDLLGASAAGSATPDLLCRQAQSSICVCMVLDMTRSL